MYRWKVSTSDVGVAILHINNDIAYSFTIDELSGLYSRSAFLMNSYSISHDIMKIGNCIRFRGVDFDDINDFINILLSGFRILEIPVCMVDIVRCNKTLVLSNGYWKFSPMDIDINSSRPIESISIINRGTCIDVIGDGEIIFKLITVGDGILYCKKTHKNFTCVMMQHILQFLLSESGSGLSAEEMSNVVFMGLSKNKL